MADKDLRGVVFPGLPGTYLIPEVDATLSKEGRAAEAQETGKRLRALETMTPDEMMEKLGITASAEELNYMAGVVDPVQFQLDSLSTADALLAERWFKSVNNTDMNTVKGTGFYFGYTGMTNAAAQTISVWEVIAYSSDWGIQRQTVINSDGTTKTYERSWYAGSNWKEWTAAGGGSAAGMTREFNSGAINVDSYTTPGAMAKIYVVTVRINGIDYSITVDWQGIKAAGGERTFGIAAKNSGGTIAIFDLIATLNTGSTITFEISGGTIVHVCGYY